MQQSVILFLALLSTVVFITATITRVINPTMSYNHKKMLAYSRIILALATCFLWALFHYYSNKPINLTHKCIDTTHNTCDSKCECDGLNCN